MITVRLYTNTFEFVHEAQIPPFQIPPDVMLWGSRTFKLVTTLGIGLFYVEAFTFAIVEIEEDDKKV